MRSILGFRYPFFNGSSFVSNKGLWDPNRPSNVTIIRTNIFCINIPIIINIKNIVGVVMPRKVTTSGLAPCGTTTRNGSLGLCGLSIVLLVVALLAAEKKSKTERGA